MPTYNHGNITAKLTGSKIPKSGTKLLDNEGHETGLSLFNCSLQKDTIILSTTKNSRIDYKSMSYMMEALGKQKENMNDILKVSRNISIDLNKNLIVHGDICDSCNIMNYVKFNDIFVPMFSNEIKELTQKTGNNVVIDTNKINLNMPSSYSETFYQFNHLFIPLKTPMTFSEDNNVNDKHDIILENKHNDFSELDMSHVKNSNIIIYNDDNAKIYPPKISPTQQIKITSLLRKRKHIKRDTIAEFLDNNVRFKYYFNDSPHDKKTFPSINDYVENHLNNINYGIRTYNFQRVAEFISILNELENKGIDAKDVFPDIKKESEFKYIYDNNDEISKHHLIKEHSVSDLEI